MIWFSAMAMALPPDQQVDRIAVGDVGSGGEVDGLYVSHGGSMLVGRDINTSQGFLLDLDTWQMHPIPKTGGSACETSGCCVTGITAFENPQPGATSSVWMSCSDGSVEERTYDGQAVSTNGEVTSIVDGNSLSAIFYDSVSQTNLLYAIELPVGGTKYGNRAIVHAIDPANPKNQAPITGYPKLLTAAGFVEGVVVADVYDNLATLVVSHGAGDMSSLQLNNPSASAIPENAQALNSCDDLAASPRPNEVYCLDQYLDQVWRYQTTTNSFTGPILADLTDPEAVGLSDSTEDGWIAVTGSRVRVWEMDAFGVVVDPTSPYFEGPDNGDDFIRDIVSSDGYFFGGGAQGHLRLATAKPWIDRASFSVSPEAVATGETVDVAFEVADRNVSWRVVRGGDRTDTGTLLQSGSAVAGELVETSFGITSSFTEGSHDIFVFVTDDQDQVGHGRATVRVDNAPERVRLSEVVGFGNKSLTISFSGLTAADIVGYEVFVSDESFDPGDPTWDDEPYGPELVSLGRSFPYTEDASPGEDMSIEITKLKNGTEHYIAVRAVDQGGNVGPMSNVVTGVPSPGLTATDLAKEKGGAPCSTGPGSASGVALAALLGLGAALGRRRRLLAAVLVGLGLSSVAPAPALAQDDDASSRSIWLRRDSTPVRGDFEFRYGSFAVDDPSIQTVHGSSLSALQFEAGPQIIRFFEIDLGFALTQDRGHPVREDGAAGTDEVRLTIMPVSIDVTARAHILDEQPVVPFVRYGWDYAFWNEKRLDVSGRKLAGAKTGTHYGAGLNLLLDTLSPNRASLLEAQTGINDTWLTLEWRRNSIDGRNRPWQGPKDKGLSFSGDIFSVGLKLDY